LWRQIGLVRARQSTGGRDGRPADIQPIISAIIRRSSRVDKVGDLRFRMVRTGWARPALIAEE
jgi:hypothetical protein